MRKLFLIGLTVLLSSCTYFNQGLPFPESPEVTVFRAEVGDQPLVCFGPEDATEMAKWFDKLEAFKHAYERGK